MSATLFDVKQLPVTTTVGTPGVDTLIPTEKAVRDAIGGLLPSYTPDKVMYTDGAGVPTVASNFAYNGTGVFINGSDTVPVTQTFANHLVSETAGAWNVQWTYSDTDANYLIGYRARNTKVAPAVLQSGDVMLYIRGRGWDGAWSGSRAGLALVADGLWDANNHQTKITFSATPAGAGANMQTVATMFGSGVFSPLVSISSPQVYENQPVVFAGRSIKLVSPYTVRTHVYKGQLHCHSTNSDGTQTPAQLVTDYKNAGFEFISITDHDVLTADPGVGGITFIPGVEETAQTYGHIGHLNATSQVALPDAQNVIDAILADSDGVAILNHPNYATDPWTDQELESVFGHYGIEIWNAQVNPNENAEVKWDTLLTKYHKVFGFATDDCHNTGTAARFNRGSIHVFADSNTAVSVMDAIRRGNFYATHTVVGGTEIGITNVVVDQLTITIVISAPGTIEFIGAGGVVLQTNAPVSTASYVVTGEEIYVRIRVTVGTDQAWTNPIYVDRQENEDLSHGGVIHGTVTITDTVFARAIEDTVTGLIVQAHSVTQSANLAEFRNSAGSPKVYIGPAGTLSVGTAPSASVAGYFFQTATNPATSQYGNINTVRVKATVADAGYHYGGTFAAEISADSTANFTGLLTGGYFVVVARATGALTATSMYGMSGSVQIVADSKVTITNARGIVAGGGNYSTVGGIITTFQMLRVSAPVVTGVIHNVYGLYIDDISGADTLNYSVYTNSGPVSLLGSMTKASAAGATWKGIELRAATATITGSTNITTAAGFNYFDIAQPTLSAASALTVTNSATVHITNAPVGAGAGPVTITNAYALWVDAGTTRLDGDLVHQGTNLTFYNGTPRARGAALTAQLTTITYTAPVTPDYAIQDFTQVSPWGFASHDEANSVLAVIANLQARVAELEARLGSATGVNLFA
jgi:hypothetical protein